MQSLAFSHLLLFHSAFNQRMTQEEGSHQRQPSSLKLLSLYNGEK
jgi:hypothetical protein